MDEREYRLRIVDAAVEHGLDIAGGVVIEGPRGCGKTRTGLHHSASVFYADLAQSRRLAEIDPLAPFDGATPRLIDEWSVIPDIWNEARHLIDERPGKGHFILTGSAVPADDVTRHTGAARFLRVAKRTMTWAEKGISQPTVSLRGLFAGDSLERDADTWSLDQVIDGILTSAFPAQIDLAPADAAVLLRSYQSDLSRADLPRLLATRQSPEVIESLIQSFARNTSSQVSLATLRKDLMDPAFAAAVLGVGHDGLREDLSTLGLLFESAVSHDLAVMVEALGGKVYHYRNSNTEEIDLVAELPDGQWAAIEVKLGMEATLKAMEKLPEIISHLDMPTPPVFTAVVTGLGTQFTAENAVMSIPFGALGL
ncbi:MAG: DUF4143 domain-containing protein [Corynebacterium sp.]|nr:DUF4143 domain-containing protein [Corynebacterium sp.]